MANGYQDRDEMRLIRYDEVQFYPEPYSAATNARSVNPFMSDFVSFQPVLYWPVIVLIAGSLFALMMLRPDFPDITVARWRTILLIRTAVIAMAVLALLRPGCISEVETGQSAQVRILLDTSRSLELPHETDRSRRWDVLKETLDRNRLELAKLEAEKIEVTWEGFDQSSRPLDVSDSLPVLPDEPEGSETDIAQAVYNSIRESRDKRVLATIVFTDGVQNSVELPVDLTDAIALAANREIPFYPVPLGLPEGVGETADVAVVSLADHHSVAVKNRLEVRTMIASRGFANRQINVQLVVSKPGGPEEVVDTRFITPAEASTQSSVNLYYVPTEPGQYRMAVRALALPGEIALRNNELTSFLSVEEGGMRVLMLVGNLGNEQQFLKRSIGMAAQGIEVDFFPVLPGGPVRWPLGEQLTSTLRDPSYDVIVLMDVDSRAFVQGAIGEANIEALLEHVSAGKGLLMMGGDHSFGPGLWHSTRLADALPVVMSKTERQEFNTPVDTSLHLAGPLKMVPEAGHFLTRLDEAADWREAWKEIPPLVCANRFTRIKDGAQILLKSENGQPLMVWGGYGAGRVLAFAGDSTWRWPMKGFSAQYNTFWRQIFYWLAFRDGQENDLVRIEMPGRRFQPESSVSFSADAVDSAGRPIGDATFEASLVAPDGERSPVALQKSAEKHFAEIERKLISSPGIYKIEVSAARGAEEIGRTAREFSISDNDREKSQPMANHELLRRMADQTAEFGGKIIPPDLFGELLTSLRENLPELKSRVPVKWQLGQTTGDGLAYLAIFTLLLAAEWYLRKKWGMV